LVGYLRIVDRRVWERGGIKMSHGITAKEERKAPKKQGGGIEGREGSYQKMYRILMSQGPKNSSDGGSDRTQRRPSGFLGQGGKNK